MVSTQLGARGATAHAKRARGHMWIARLGARGATAHAKRARGSCGVLGWERGERRHKRKRLALGVHGMWSHYEKVSRRCGLMDEPRYTRVGGGGQGARQPLQEFTMSPRVAP